LDGKVAPLKGRRILLGTYEEGKTTFIRNLVLDFFEAARLAQMPICPKDLFTELLEAPHKPNSLPPGHMAVYSFFWKGQCLKVGKVGMNSGPRYLSQHYNPKSSVSNLAASMLKASKEMGLLDLDEHNVGDWIRERTDRVNFILPSKAGVPVLNLLEAFLQCRLNPRFEGFESQRGR
jgi:hypothetical protein